MQDRYARLTVLLDKVKHSAGCVPGMNAENLSPNPFALSQNFRQNMLLE